MAFGTHVHGVGDGKAHRSYITLRVQQSRRLLPLDLDRMAGNVAEFDGLRRSAEVWTQRQNRRKR